MSDLEKKLSTWSLSGLYLVLLIWKNGVLQKRRPLWTAVEILAPTLFMLILVALRQIALVNDTGDFCLERVPDDYDGNNYFEDCEWGAFQPDQGFTAFSSDNCAESGWNVVYTPADADSLFVMTHAMSHLRAKTNVSINITGVKSADLVADSLFVNNRTNASCVFVVEFDQLSLDTATASYTLRFTNVPGGIKSTGTFLDDTLNQETWHTDRSFSSTILGGGPRLSSYSGLYSDIDKFGSDPNYEGNGFLAAQFHINRALVHEMLSRSVDVAAADTATSQMDNMYLQRFPFPRWTDNTFATLIKGILPLFLVLTLLLTALFIVKSVVEEKESGLKETLRMLGITSGIQWSAWFFLYLILMFTSMSIVTIILTAGQVLQHSDGTLIFVYLMLFATSSITFMFMVSVFFHQASTAAASAAVIWFCSYIPYRFLTPDWDSLAPETKTLGCLLSTTCMSIGANVIGELEGTGTGVTWENMYSPVNADDHFTFATVLTMLIVDTFLYAFITLYLDAVLPSQFGTTKPWYFCFLPSFWCSSFSSLRRSGNYSILADDLSDDMSSVNDNDNDNDCLATGDNLISLDTRTVDSDFFNKTFRRKPSVSGSGSSSRSNNNDLNMDTTASASLSQTLPEPALRTSPTSITPTTSTPLTTAMPPHLQRSLSPPRLAATSTIGTSIHHTPRSSLSHSPSFSHTQSQNQSQTRTRAHPRSQRSSTTSIPTHTSSVLERLGLTARGPVVLPREPRPQDYIDFKHKLSEELVSSRVYQWDGAMKQFLEQKINDELNPHLEKVRADGSTRDILDETHMRRIIEEIKTSLAID
eukprot:m.189343 g.189343  ORF g.189343 m.189343 type:complete len:815 (+) comp32371_c0_seq1:265-2709(+)